MLMLPTRCCTWFPCSGVGLPRILVYTFRLPPALPRAGDPVRHRSAGHWLRGARGPAGRAGAAEHDLLVRGAVLAAYLLGTAAGGILWQSTDRGRGGTAGPRVHA